MSRAYRISVRESLRRVVTAKDRVSTQLEILEVLPPEQMAELLANELEQRGYERDGEEMVKQLDNGVTVRVDTKTGTITVHAECAQQVDIEREKEGRAYDDAGTSAEATRKQLREDLRKDLERQAAQETAKLQTEVTDRLERELSGLRQELDQAVNRVTAEALKVKAAQMGQIKELTEDPQSGSLTIVVEV